MNSWIAVLSIYLHEHKDYPVALGIAMNTQPPAQLMYHSPLLDLPLELTLGIASKLDRDCYARLRQTCKHLAEKLRKHHGELFYSICEISVDHVNLDRLNWIANRPDLASRIHTLTLVMLEYDWRDRRPRVKALKYLHRTVLLTTGRARDLLVHGISRFNNLSAVTLTDCHDRFPGG